MVGQVYLPYHAEIFHRQHGYLFLFKLVQTHAPGQDGHAEVPADKVLDGSDVVGYDVCAI